MTLTHRPSEQRGHANHGWLDTHHTFSFADYFDPAHMGFRSLRVINDDVIQAGAGFPTHGHKDMEIVSYIVRGALAHKDSTGSEGVLRPGDVQAMSAGAGVRHSEFNASKEEDARLIQIWLLPEREGLRPAYRQTNIPESAKHNKLQLIVSPDGAAGALAIHQDAQIYASLLDPGASVTHTLHAGRGAWIQMIEGTVTVNGETLQAGDGLALEDVSHISIAAQTKSELLLFDLA